MSREDRASTNSFGLPVKFDRKIYLSKVYFKARMVSINFTLNFTADSANRLYTLYCHPTSLLFSLLAARARALGTFRLEKRNYPWRGGRRLFSQTIYCRIVYQLDRSNRHAIILHKSCNLLSLIFLNARQERIWKAKLYERARHEQVREEKETSLSLYIIISYIRPRY